jgi:imidazolonepropionase-like amidohydrolase
MNRTIQRFLEEVCRRGSLHSFRLSAVLWLACGGGLGCTAREIRAQAAKIDAQVFEDVTVISMLDEHAHPHQTVVIEAGGITQVGARGSVRIPEGATPIAAKGRYLMPGMMDMHVHLPEEAPVEELERMLDLFLVNGVTTLRSMRGSPAHLVLRERLHAEMRAVPTLYLSGPAVAEFLTPQQAVESVSAQKDAGYDFLKLLGGVDRNAYDALVARAGELSFPVAGHVVAAVGIDAALGARQRTIEHLGGYDAAAKAGPESLAALAQRTQEAGVCNCPTLDFFAVTYAQGEAQLRQRDGLRYAKPEEREQWHQEKLKPPSLQGEARMQRNTAIVSALSAAKALLIVGTDSPGTYRVPGFSYSEELSQFTRSGLSPYEALRAATRNPAACMGMAETRGAVAPGMRADLVLLEKNPLEDVRNVSRPAGVMVGGQWLSRAELDRRLELLVPLGADTTAPPK